MLQSITLTAGVSVQISEQANFFRLLSAAAAVNVDFYKNGAKVVDAYGVTGGYAESFSDAFDRIVLTSATTQSIQFVTRLGNQVKYDAPPQGLVTVTNFSGNVTHSNPTVTTTAAQLVAANTARRYLLIQNNDAAGIVYINFSGTATAANGIKIAPGGSYVADSSFCPTNAISAIGSIASNANISVVTG